MERMTTSLSWRRFLVVVAMLATLAGCAAPGPGAGAANNADLVAQVRAVEEAFAKTMADRDFDAFQRFVADEAIFANGGQPLAGKAAIAQRWRRFYEPAAAPFSWKPEQVYVLASGRLAETEGPVMDPTGKVFARFRSTWRLEVDGRWRVVFDNGHPVCDCPRR